MSEIPRHIEQSDCEFSEKEIVRLEAEIAKRDEVIDKLEDYVQHTNRCILSFWEAGEPTPDGGYRSKFAGKWYQSRPIDETPKCNCGLDEALAFKKEKLDD